MAKITKAVAIANNEVAFLAWTLDVIPLPGCLGFHIVREHLDDHDRVLEERPLASYVSFKGQSNPGMAPQNTTVWPVQKFTWRDLTLRRRRNAASQRPPNQRVRYRIRGVGKLRPGLTPVETIEEISPKTGKANTYVGGPIPLGYLTDAAYTNVIVSTANHPPFTATFTNGILSTQFLVHVLEEDGQIKPGELKKHLVEPKDWLRRYLTGDVLPLMRAFFDQQGGRFHAALYELEDTELVDLLKDHADRIDLILSDAGVSTTGQKPNQVTVYDSRNAPARAAVQRLADQPGSALTLQNRMFNGSGHIGHNKFVVHVGDDGSADSVLTGSTNWTWSGVAGQSNNCIRIDDDEDRRSVSRVLEASPPRRAARPQAVERQEFRSRPVGLDQAIRHRPRPDDGPWRIDDRGLVLAQHAREVAATDRVEGRSPASGHGAALLAHAEGATHDLLPRVPPVAGRAPLDRL